jgi:hypothetical protein
MRFRNPYPAQFQQAQRFFNRFPQFRRRSGLVQFAAALESIFNQSWQFTHQQHPQAQAAGLGTAAKKRHNKRG